MRIMTALMLGTALCLSACSDKAAKTDAPMAEANADFQETLMTQLIDAKPGDVITVPEGVFAIDRGLSLSVDGVTIRGAGMDKTVLSFKGQKTGAEGLLVTASNFTIEDIAFEDTIGDAIKVTKGDNIIFRRVRTEWTNGPDTNNGAYGLYPVQTTNVLIEECISIAAADAGIYVGQSKNIVVRNNIAEYNVAGIEIENSQDADVYGNVAKYNTGGILVFNMPNLPQVGANVRVYENVVKENNTKNFGHEGTPVASIPAGSGIVINSHDDVEIFANSISDNRTANIIISSVYTSNYADSGMDDNFDPYPQRISIRENAFDGGGNKPDGLDLKALKTAMFGPMGSFPDVLWDGYADEGIDAQICIDNPDVEVINADVPNGSKNARVERDPFNCALDPLPAVTLASAE